MVREEDTEDVVLFINNRNCISEGEKPEEEEDGNSLHRKQPRIEDEEDARKNHGNTWQEKEEDENLGESGPGATSEMVGYALMALAACCYSTMMLGIRKVVAYDGMMVSEVIFMRGLIQTMVSMAVILSPVSKERWQSAFVYPGRLCGMVIMRGFLGACALACYYKAAQYLPLGIVTSIYCMNPVMVMLLAAVSLGERLGRAEIIATVVTIIGGILVADPASTYVDIDIDSDVHKRVLAGCSLALAAACIGACSYTALRNIATKIRYISSVLSFGVCVLVMGYFMGGSQGFLLSPYAKSTLYSAVAASLAGTAAQAAMAKGYQYCRAGTGAIIRYFEVPLSYLMAILFLKENPKLISVVGSAIVLVGIAMVAIEGSRKKKKKTKNKKKEKINNNSII